MFYTTYLNVNGIYTSKDFINFLLKDIKSIETKFNSKLKNVEDDLNSKIDYLCQQLYRQSYDQLIEKHPL